MKVLVITTGCAECNWLGAPLMEAKEFDSVEEAKASVELTGWLSNGFWESHPQGGERVTVGQGEVWILPTKLKEPE